VVALAVSIQIASDTNPFMEAVSKCKRDILSILPLANITLARRFLFFTDMYTVLLTLRVHDTHKWN